VYLCVCLFDSMLCCVLCYFIIFPFKENIVTRTAIGKECLTALYLNCGGTLTKIIKLKTNFDFEKEEKRTASLLQYQS